MIYMPKNNVYFIDHMQASIHQSSIYTNVRKPGRAIFPWNLHVNFMGNVHKMPQFISMGCAPPIDLGNRHVNLLRKLHLEAFVQMCTYYDTSISSNKRLDPFNQLRSCPYQDKGICSTSIHPNSQITERQMIDHDFHQVISIVVLACQLLDNHLSSTINHLTSKRQACVKQIS